MRVRFVFAMVAVLAPVGCASLLGVSGYSDSTEELCRLLEQCYQVEDCRARLAPRLDAAGETERSQWLSAVTDQACLEQCSAARRCLNIAPVCSPQSAPCQSSQECCGFLGGVRACGPSGVCCLSKGASCASPADCCDGDCSNGHCGGTQCFQQGEPCLNPFDCCTNICADGFCSEGVCIELGGVCANSEECCEGKCLDGRCGYEQCRTANEACVATTECCQGLECFDIPSSPGKKLCQAEKPCAPLAFPCQVSADCCAGDGKPLVCDPAQKLCGEPCLAKGSSCLGDGQCCGKKCEAGVCACSQDACTQTADCCSGQCIGGKCVSDCGTVSCHDECVPGGPLGSKCSSSVAPKIDPACIKQVCDKDGYCCCKDWDLTCVKLALSECGKAACQ